MIPPPTEITFMDGPSHISRNMDPSEIMVRCGDWDIKDDLTERFIHQNRPLKSISIHPRFDENIRNLYHDIAILHLTEEFDMKYPNIDITCLPDFKGENFNSTDCVTMGWGKDASRRKYPFYQKLLKQVNLNIVDHETCQTGLRTTRLKNDFILHKSMICAGGEEGKDACEGDGGGPLVCKAHDSDRYKNFG